MRRTTSSGRPPSVSVTKSSGSRVPSACGQSDPSSSRSVVKCSAISTRSSSQNGVTQTCSRERRARNLVEESGVAVGRVVEAMKQIRDPRGAVLDARHAQRREPFEHLVADRRCVEVAHRAGLGDDPAQWRTEQRALGPARLPHLDQGVVAVVAGVGGDHHTRLGRQAPERVVLRGERRPVPAGHRDGSIAHVDDDRASIEGELQLVGGRRRVEHLDVRHGEDPTLGTRSPSRHPTTVERVEGGSRGLGVVPQRIFDPDAERGEEQRRCDLLIVHHLEAHVAVPVLGPDRLELTERLDDRHAAADCPGTTRTASPAWPPDRTSDWRCRSSPCRRRADACARRCRPTAPRGCAVARSW